MQPFPADTREPGLAQTTPQQGTVTWGQEEKNPRRKPEKILGQEGLVMTKVLGAVTKSSAEPLQCLQRHHRALKAVKPAFKDTLLLFLAHLRDGRTLPLKF